jgi:hypothetical protein
MAALSKSRQPIQINAPKADGGNKLKNITAKRLAAINVGGLTSHCIHLYFIGSSS